MSGGLEIPYGPQMRLNSPVSASITATRLLRSPSEIYASFVDSSPTMPDGEVKFSRSMLPFVCPYLPVCQITAPSLVNFVTLPQFSGDTTVSETPSSHPSHTFPLRSTKMPCSRGQS